VGVQVRDTLAGRRELDITLAEYADAVARVEQRRADVIRVRRQVRAASDALRLLINDPQMTISSEAVLYPLDQTIEAPISYNLREAILTAIDNRPEIQQAALGIQDATIRERVTGNERLPLLNLSAQMAYSGLDDNAGGAYDNLGGGDFIDYVLGLAFEYPLGNRAAEARHRAAGLQRTATVLGYQRAVQDVILDVKSALRDVITNYELILATRSFRVAQAENLRTLLVEEQTLAGLTPEFLNLKFTRQETLAQAQRQEVQSLVNFDKSVAALYRAMGIGLAMKKINVEVTVDDE
jgi:outer membrane protein TolC